MSAVICIALFRFVDHWNHWMTIGFSIYFYHFISFYLVTQKNKDLRKKVNDEE